MDPSTQAAVIEQLLRRIGGERPAGEGGETYAPVHVYSDPERHRRELGAIFRRSPLIAAHVSQLQRPGDFTTATVCGAPVLLTCPAPGRVSAFLNVCRHRNALLVRERTGSGAKAFVCGYHAWTYDADGRLAHVPDQEACFPGLDRGERGLVRLPVAVRAGFAWVWLDPGGAGEARPAEARLAEYLGPLGAELDSYGFDRYVYYREEEVPGAFDWKVAMESFLENYHFAVLHRRSTHPIFVHNVSLFDRLGRHIRVVAPKRSLARLAAAPAEEWDLRPHATILYSIFPNSCLFVEKRHLSLLQLLPERAGRCRVRMTHVVERDSLQQRPYYEENIALFLSAVREDLDICESMQVGLESGADRAIVFGATESACACFRRNVELALEGERGEEGP
jgi:phenylpropionate dioxygenase-like ring-hydroxylating dioxygenase large terminal subunit